MRTSSSVIARLGGTATALGGALWAIGGATSLNATALGIEMDGPHLVLVLAGLLSLLGLARLASHHVGRYGLAAAVGVLVAGGGVVLVMASKLPLGMSSAAGWAVFYTGGLLLVVGSLVVGTVALAVARAWLLGGSLVAIGVFTILQMVLLMVPAGEPGPLATVVFPVLIGAAWIALGYALWSSADDAVPRLPRRAATAHD